MGFNEDDRIRSKNAVHNTAYNLYLNLKSEGLSDAAIAKYVSSVHFTDNDHNRNEISAAVLGILKVSSDNTASANNSSSTSRRSYEHN